MTDGFLDFLLEKELKQAGRPKVLPNPLAIYDHEYSRIPDRIRVSFADGSTAVYELRTDQPHPLIVENIRIIRKMKQGYVNQPERRRKKK